MKPVVVIKRVYEPYKKSDGQRVLVDRLWPRGLTKEKANISLWLKDIAPSTELRKWFNHETEKWPEFQKLYRAELDLNDSSISTLLDCFSKGPTVIVYSAKDEAHNDAVVLRDYLKDK